MTTLSSNGSFGAEHKINTPAPTPTQQPPAPQPKLIRMCECGQAVTESQGICPICHNQINESTAKPLLLD